MGAAMLPSNVRRTSSAPARRLALLMAAILATSGAAAAAPSPYYTVKRGEYLSLIAARHKTTVSHLVKLNGLKSTVLRVGQRIWLVEKPQSVVLEQRKVLGVPVKVVRVDLNNPQVSVRPLFAPGGIGQGASIDRLASGSSALAIINGGYFHPKTFIPTGDLVLHGKQVFSGRVRTALAITPDNLVSIRAAKMNSLVSWRGYQTVIANGPYILRGGKVAAYPQAEGYRDPAVWGRASRSAIGVTSQRKLFLLSTRAPLTLSELAKVMRALGAREAITLDGGSSVGMAWKGKVLIRPARRIAYGVAVYATQAR
ncbi:MAG TPA: phosphodiester glycosidase family protein [Deinococcales bacterium]|nr:phosphodiester glycosidase family protein [Deinococcales bacterium]